MSDAIICDLRLAPAREGPSLMIVYRVFLVSVFAHAEQLTTVSACLGAQVSFTLFLHCPKEELKKRLLERGETSGRADDNVETVLKRFDTFEKESLPVVEQLELLGMVSVNSHTLNPTVSHCAPK